MGKIVNKITGYDITDIEKLYDEYGLTYNSGKGDYRIMGGKDGSSLNLRVNSFVIYTRDDDFGRIQKENYDAEDLVLEPKGNARDDDRPNTVRCEKRETLNKLLSIYARNAANKLPC